MTVLGLARDLDSTADRMVTVLGERGVEAFRVNTAWFLTRVQVSVGLRDGRWCVPALAPVASAHLGKIRAHHYGRHARNLAG